jgi:hypothetical protein
MNAPYLHYWTINSCFGAFLFVRVHFGPFHYCTKLGAKRAKLVQLMQKLMPRCRCRIFRNESSRSTPLDPKLMFWCVCFHLGAFGTVSSLHETFCKRRQTGTINAKVRATMSCWKFSQRTLPIHTIGTQTHVLLRFFPFGCIWNNFATARNLVQIALNWCN